MSDVCVCVYVCDTVCVYIFVLFGARISYMIGARSVIFLVVILLRINSRYCLYGICFAMRSTHFSLCSFVWVANCECNTLAICSQHAAIIKLGALCARTPSASYHLADNLHLFLVWTRCYFRFNCSGKRSFHSFRFDCTGWPFYVCCIFFFFFL